MNLYMWGEQGIATGCCILHTSMLTVIKYLRKNVSIRLGLQSLLKWIICQDIEPGQWFRNGDLGCNNSERD
jgi:hypothetical protein